MTGNYSQQIVDVAGKIQIRTNNRQASNCQKNKTFHLFQQDGWTVLLLVCIVIRLWQEK